MPDSLDNAPIFLVFLFFFGIAFVRTQATYWLARYVEYKTIQNSTFTNPTMKRLADWINANSDGKGVRAVHKWGALAVFGSFFMSGTKTVINTAAGLTRMYYPVWFVAMTLGCIAHGIIYATIGWVAWLAAISALAGSPLGIAAIVLIVLAGAAAIVITRVRIRNGAKPATDPATVGAEAPVATGTSGAAAAAPAGAPTAQDVARGESELGSPLAALPDAASVTTPAASQDA